MKRLAFLLVMMVTIISVSHGQEIFSGGKGTEEDPYRIATASDFIELSNRLSSFNNIGTENNDVKNMASSHFKVIKSHIDFMGVEFPPINDFKGIFDGGGVVLKNLFINVTQSDSKTGLFCKLEAGGIVKNIVLDETCKVSGRRYTGGIVGYNMGTVEGCENRGEISVTYAYGLGGIVGYNREGIVSGCLNSGKITHESDLNLYKGGIVGHNYEGTISGCTNKGSLGCFVCGGIVGCNSKKSTISGCVNEGAITDGAYVGGILGYIDYDPMCTIRDCTNYGNINCTITRSTDEGAGGIVGSCGLTIDAAEIIDCMNYGTLTSVGKAGGISACNGKINNCVNYGNISSSRHFVGGIVGSSSFWAIKCYNYGEISGNNSVGGIVGGCGEITECHNEGKVSGIGSNIGGISGGSCKKIVDSENTADVIGEGDNVGGIEGIADYQCSITHCSNSGAVTSSGLYTGGVVGKITINQYSNDRCSVTECTNTGKINGIYYVGGLSGYPYGSFENCFNNGDVESKRGFTGALLGFYYDKYTTIRNNYYDKDVKVTIGDAVYQGLTPRGVGRGEEVYDISDNDGAVIKKSDASTQMWWGYFSESDATNPIDGSLGYSSAVTIDAAIYVPENHNFVGGSTIKAIRLWLGTDMSSITGDVKIWIAKTLPSDLSAVDYVQDIPLSSLAAGQNDIELSTPYKVNNAGIYIGYTFAISGRAYPVVCAGEDKPNGFFYHNSTNSNWMDYSTVGYGKLALQILIDGGSYPENQAVVESFGQSVVLKGGSISIPIKITNDGKNAIESISYTISTKGGSTTNEATLSFNAMEYGATVTKNISFNADEDIRKYEKTFTITKVNGVENTSSGKSAKGYVITVAEKPAVVPVVEEFTATWCGYCPYGMVGMQEAHEAYGDKAALIAVHSSDIMAISGYSPILASVKSFPSANLNRETGFYPSNVSYYVERAMNRTVQGSIQAVATWKDAGKTSIDINTSTTFVYDDDNGDYGIAYVIVADGLTGTGSDWAQTNYLSGRSLSGGMEFWGNAASEVTGLKYDHVAVAAWGIQSGVSGSVSSTIKTNESQKYAFNADITSASLIQDKSKLKVITLLIDNISGTIVNAAVTTIKEPSAGTVGDMTGDGAVNAADVMAIMNFISGYAGSIALEKADINGDGVVNVADIIAIINIIAGKE